jgi:DNA-binding CsgD family transcriptional regulator
MINAERKQQILIGVGLFFSLLAISFSIDENETRWFWQRTPIVAIVFMLLAFFVVRVWVLLERERQKEEIQQAIQSLQAKHDTSFHDMLSAREKEVAAQILAGKSNKEIAESLYIELSTVKTHINNIYKILDVKNRREAIEKIGKGI